MSTYTGDLVSEEAYLVAEPQAEYKSEYRRGRVVAMAGASAAHIQITANLHGELFQRLRGHDCRVLGGDTRVRAAKARYYTYPDVTVVCGAPDWGGQPELGTLVNPTLIVEVLSPATEAYDRGEKFEAYKTIDSLREYLLVRQDAVGVERFVRQADGAWAGTSYASAGDVVALESIGVGVAVGEMYASVF